VSRFAMDYEKILLTLALIAQTVSSFEHGQTNTHTHHDVDTG